MLNTVKT